MTREPLSRVLIAYDADVTPSSTQFPDIAFDIAGDP